MAALEAYPAQIAQVLLECRCSWLVADILQSFEHAAEAVHKKESDIAQQDSGMKIE